MRAQLSESAAGLASWLERSLSQPVESTHPYENESRFEQKISGPAGTEAIQVHVRIETEEGYDFVELLDDSGRVVFSYSGSGEGWAPEVSGRSATIRLTSDRSITGWGVQVDRFRYLIDSGSSPSNGRWVSFPVSVETPHPYANDSSLQWNLRGPRDAAKIRFRFSSFDLEDQYDTLWIFDGAGKTVSTLSGNRGAFTSAEISGRRGVLRFGSDGSVAKQGFRISHVEALLPNGQAGTCSADDDCTTGHSCRSGQCQQAAQSQVAGSGQWCSSSRRCRSGLTCSPVANSSRRACVSSAWAYYPIGVGTRHPYANNSVQRLMMASPSWTSSFQIDFSGFDVEHGYDVAAILADGSEVDRLTGALGSVTTQTLRASTAEVRLISDNSVTGYGFDIAGTQAYGIPDDLVAIAIDPRLCTRLPTSADRFRSLLQSMGVGVYGVDRYRFQDQSCSSCTCATGERFVVIVSAKDATEVKELDRYTGVIDVGTGSVVHEGRLADVRVQPIRCGGTPWGRGCTTAACAAPSDPTAVTDWAQARRLSAFGATIVPAVSTCTGCGCKASWSVEVAADRNDISSWRALGFAD